MDTPYEHVEGEAQKKEKKDLIVMDPPWPNGAGMALWQPSAHSAYPRMTMKQIRQMKIEEMLSEQSIVLVWTTAQYMYETMRIMEGWGLKGIMIVFVWVKTTKGKERVRTIKSSCEYPMRSCEYVLVGRKGKAPVKKTPSVREVIWASPREHSRKPDEFWKQLDEWLGDQYPRRLEMFSREPHPGFEQHGNQTDYFQSPAAAASGHSMEED